MSALSALVRGVPDSFVRAIRPPNDGPDGEQRALSVQRARAQHERYVAALTALGVAVERLEADERFPDCCFVEDPVLVVDDLVIAAPMAAPARRGEAEAVVAHLAREREVLALRPPATLDGGDVVRVGRQVFLGRSTRTNDAAAAQLDGLLRPRGFELTQVDVRGVLHLKSACTHVGRGVLLAAPGSCDLAPFASSASSASGSELELVLVPEREQRAANAVALNGSVLVAAGFPRAVELLRGRSFDVHTVDASEFALAGGSLTCLSVLLER